ncbi:MAG: YitT family protein [Clostridia bacterium]|nr:YitT family protein [Clostridia bacterium]
MKKGKIIAEYSIIIICALVSGLAFQLLIAPNNFAPAGFGGIAMLLEHFFPGLPIFGYFSLVVNVPLCIFACLCINKEFGLKSFTFCVATALGYIIFDYVGVESFQYVTQDGILPCVIGGIVSGVNYGIVVRLEASTGGTDIVAKWASKKNPLVNFFWATFIINAVVAVGSYFVYAYNVEANKFIFTNNYQPIVLCILYCFISSYIGNYMIKGTKSAYKFTVVTTHAKEINKEIIETLHHGATKLEGEGVYTGEQRDVLICVVSKHQIVDFKNILDKYDNTFAVIENVTETIGTFRRK